MTPLTVEEFQNDNDKGESFTQPGASNSYQLSLRPSGNNAGHKIKENMRVEPSPAPVTYIQQQSSQQTTSHTQSPSSFNSSQKYEPTQYDPYYNLYDEDVELYRDVDYGQLSSNAGPSSNTQYRSQSPYKQAPQPPQQEQRSASYAQPSYNTQDIYSQTLNAQDYNENLDSQQTDDQYQQQISPRQPVKSPARVSTPTRNRGTASYTATGVGGGELVNRGTPASVRLIKLLLSAAKMFVFYLTVTVVEKKFQLVDILEGYVNLKMVWDYYKRLLL
uniref:Uncharacterized protein n=2 Tax=Timema TaxID=61471 RepID=A0A7R9FKJ4_9NEOP|nr:unnamed protein product [Timema bartmani]CAD7455308.1 unnamed protein product [Timema tahoe]